jgi:glycosyltransferase involved in cell wall biosynthesis
MAPLVSILVNNYNYEQFIGEAIESSLSQTYGNIEILVIDGDRRMNRRP